MIKLSNITKVFQQGNRSIQALNNVSLHVPAGQIYGVIVGAEQQVAEVAQKVAKEKYGIDVELVTFNDYVLPNEALSKGCLLYTSRCV